MTWYHTHKCAQCDYVVDATAEFPDSDMENHDMTHELEFLREKVKVQAAMKKELMAFIFTKEMGLEKAKEIYREMYDKVREQFPDFSGEF